MVKGQHTFRLPFELPHSPQQRDRERPGNGVKGLVDAYPPPEEVINSLPIEKKQAQGEESHVKGDG